VALLINVVISFLICVVLLMQHIRDTQSHKECAGTRELARHSQNRLVEAGSGGLGRLGRYREVRFDTAV
jgi:hypothetical protein